jgi:transposase
MSRIKQQTLSQQERRDRRFSDEFKLKKLQELERGQTTISEICRAYEVSATSIYRWQEKFSPMKKKKERLIVESQSVTQEILALKAKIAELERSIGQKQILIDFKDKMIDLAEETYKIDIKKNFGSQP